MSFTPKTQPYSGKINAVTLGTGDNAIVIGGQNVLPFYTFDAPIENAPKIGIEVSDAMDGWDLPGLQDLYAGCTTMAERAKKAEEVPGVDFLCLHFESADPNGANRATADCVADAVAVAEACSKPIVVIGCKNLEKDGELLGAIADALRGKNILCMSARQENCKTVGASVVLASGQKVGAETADDINLAKQLNIMLKKDANVAADNIVMDIGTAAVGYGYEYAASTFDRIRLAALAQSDEDLQMPILAAVSLDTYSVKESTASEEDEPAWGSREERAINMEVSTAAADLTGGADAVVLRHPATIATIKQFITELI
ncbi:MAG: acetyl-CoA decarbonylase/synthase complex subunit delta [Oscillospiraceae bacterium]|nr:acetyl-CoA decarbonylase/synthase complex subunit delta [Oscillospiraceae bacterium]